MVCGGLWWFAVVCGISTDRLNTFVLAGIYRITLTRLYVLLFQCSKNGNLQMKKECILLLLEPFY